MAELLVSIAILLIISVYVVSDLSRTRQAEELASNARLFEGNVRDVQARAFTARDVLTCMVSGSQYVCEKSVTHCGANACNVLKVPNQYGIAFKQGESVMYLFGEVDDANIDHSYNASAYETIETLAFKQHRTGSSPIVIQNIQSGATSYEYANVTFGRQSGSMTITACNGSYSCGTSHQTLNVTIQHVDTGKTRIVNLNAVTGKISID